MASNPLTSSQHRPILKIIFSYAAFGLVWVSTTYLLAREGGVPRDGVLSLAKDLLFVGISTAMLYPIFSKNIRKTLIERDNFRERVQYLNLDVNDVVLLLNENGAIVEANDRAISAYGYPGEELTTKSIVDLLARTSDFSEQWGSLLKKGTLRFDVVHRRADGTEFPAEISARCFRPNRSLFVSTIVRDNSIRHDVERRLVRLKDAYAALSQANHCTNRAADRDELFRQTVDIVVRYSKLELAWIGLVDLRADSVVPLAQAGPAADYVRDLRVSVDPQSPWAKGIVGQAILGRTPIIINDLWNSDGFQPWRERLVKYRIQSWAAFPLNEGGEPTAVLALYSSDPLAFTGEVAEVLQRLADDLSLALDRLSLRLKRDTLEAELRRLKKAVEQSPVSIVISDHTGAIQYVNPAFTVTSGYAAEEALGKNPRILKSGETSSQVYADMWQQLTRGEAWAGEFHNRRKDGTLYWEEAVISPVKDSNGSISHFIAVKQDVTARREVEERARFLAFHDPLTELPNRLVAKHEMAQAIVEAQREGSKVALLFIDVDNFKRVNDSLGHSVGDELLIALVKKLGGSLREKDALSRVSGDEFLVIAPGIRDLAAVEAIAERIRRALSSPLHVSGIEISTTVSIGAAIYPDDGETFEDLQRQADMAMYCAKREGRNAFRTYSKSMESDSHEYVLTVNGIRRALENGEFVLHYQPQVHIETRHVQAAEALIRWNHPDFGLVGPNRFIPVAEESGLIVDIGNWVINEACRQAADWRNLGMDKLRIAINISALQLRRHDLERVIADALNRWNVEPTALEIELTESALVHNSTDVASLLRLLKSFGISIALDDFGTGYSNFSYLKYFDLDRLKIDQSFVRHITSNKGDIAIVRSIVQLARNFGLETIAEGVETEEALKVVHRAGCMHVQGYLFARPMPADEIPTFLADRGGITNGNHISLQQCRYFPPRIIQ